MYARQIFLCWTIVLSIFWAVTIRPHTVGAYKTYWIVAGFPFEYAFWSNGQLYRFDAGILAINVVIGLIAAMMIARICAWARCRRVIEPARVIRQPEPIVRAPKAEPSTERIIVRGAKRSGR